MSFNLLTFLTVCIQILHIECCCIPTILQPVGALNLDRLKKFKDRYSSFEDPVIPKFHYGSHYSSARTVILYSSLSYMRVLSISSSMRLHIFILSSVICLLYICIIHYLCLMLNSCWLLSSQ